MHLGKLYTCTTIPIVSIPEGPAELWVCIDTERIMSPSILSNNTGYAYMVGVKFDKRVLGFAGWAGGFFPSVFCGLIGLRSSGQG